MEERQLSTELTERRTWDRHWHGLTGGRSLVGLIASVVRKVLLRPLVARYTRRYFSPRGVVVEAGCGSSEASLGIERAERTTVGLDFSLTALAVARRNQRFDAFVCAEIRQLPFGDGSLAGIWNLGVMEHFEPPVGERILHELHRVLRADGRVVLFWPPTYGLSRWVLAPFEWIISKRTGRPFRVYPDEVNRLPSRRAGRRVLEAAGFVAERADFGPRDGFNHLIVVGRRGDG